jgi:hypothetical protein
LRASTNNHKIMALLYPLCPSTLQECIPQPFWIWAGRADNLQGLDSAWLSCGGWEVLFLRSASRLDLEKFSGMLHMSGSRMVLYVFNVPRLHKHSQRVAGLRFLMHRRVGVGASHGGMRTTRKKRASSLHLSQRSLHNAPIFRLLLKVAVNGTHQCDFLEFLRGLLGPNNQRDAMSLVACAGLWCYVA